MHVLVIGAGPSGLTAAVAARNQGAEVTVLDASRDVGGQYWRHLPTQRASELEGKHQHYWAHFEYLRRAVHSCALITNAQVWSVERDEATSRFTVNVTVAPADGLGKRALRITPDSIVIATGAHDRTLPFPGWDLPGVFTAGAAQALVKAERVRVGERVVIAGAGPFLLPVAANVASTGAKVLGVFEASHATALIRGWMGSNPWRLIHARSKAGELISYAGAFAKNRIPYRLGSAVIAAHGQDRVESVTVAKLAADWAPIPGTERRIAADAVCVSHGFVPRLEVAIAIGCEISSDRFVTVDDRQLTSVAGVYAAGEITGIGGVDVALAEGTIAGHCAGGGSLETAPAAAIRKRRGLADFAGRIERAHGIRSGWTAWLTDDTLVCRCEEVTYEKLRRGALGTRSESLRSMKLNTRVGMGICQGRICGRSVEEILAAVSPSGRLTDGALTDRRPIVTPQRVGDLARFSD